MYTRLVSVATRRARQIITDSQASREDIVKYLHIPAEQVHVVHLAPDPACRRVSDERMMKAVRRKYGLPDEYLLYLGGFDQRKNLRGLLQVYQCALQMQGEQLPPLVVAGRLPSAASALFPDPRRMAQELGIGQRVFFPGWVEEQDKATLYSAARAFLFLSLYEGFGLMPLEAMACGAVVLAANTSSLPEVVGDGGLLVDPADVDGTAASLVGVLRDSAQQEQVREAALAQASRFDWRTTAAQTRGVYDLALCRSRKR